MNPPVTPQATGPQSVAPIRNRKATTLLLIEDNPDDARLFEEMLNQTHPGAFTVYWRQLLGTACDSLSLLKPDIVLVDLGLPDSQGLSTFERLRTAAPDIPIIVLTGLEDEELAQRTLAEGAQDYLVKGEVDGRLLYRAIRYALERHHVQSALREKTEHLEQLNQLLARQHHQLLEQSKALAEANEKLTRLSELKSEFVASVSHDLRTPLTSIIEGICLTEDGTLGPITEEQRKYLHAAREEAERLAGLINDILDVSRIEAGKIIPDRVRLQLAQPVARVMRRFQLQLQEKSLTATISIPESLPPILVDPEHYERILTNLVSNAVKFTPAGGSITVRAFPGPPGMVTTAVRDTGIGIPRNQQGRLFGRFERISRPGTCGTTGTGLGLALARQLVELNGGRIGFESEEDKGSTFHFALPVYKYLDDLDSALKRVSHNARASASQILVWLLVPTVTDAGESQLGRLAAAIQPVVHNAGAVRIIPELPAVIVIATASEEQVQELRTGIQQAITDAGIGNVRSASHLCPEPLPDAANLLAGLKRRLSHHPARA